jgi:DNA-directed RNA polymerase subunit RPC12/RpoP
MKKYKCPYCEKEAYSFFSKMMAGGMASKGVKCPSCGKHSVHGIESTVFRTVVMAVALTFMLVNYFGKSADVVLCLIVFAAAFLICKIANGLFFELTENNRRDIR